MSEQRPKILLIKPILPYPPNQGTRVVSFDLIRALQPQFDVTVLARIMSRDEQANADELAQWCDRVVTVFPTSRKSFLHRILFKLLYVAKSLLTRRSLKSLYDCPGSFLTAARKLHDETGGFDLVIVEYWQLYKMLDIFPPEKTVLFTHDIDLLVNRHSSLLERRLLRKLAKVRRWLVEQREEVTTYRRCRRVWALTERDAKSVRTVAKGRPEVWVVPFGVDVESYPPAQSESRDPGEVLFMGALQASFNRDALDYLARNIAPLLLEIPGVRITIVGGALPPDLAWFEKQDRVEVVGRVDDVQPYLARAGCMVVPLRFGGGLRIRILEAMAAGVPIVCSTVAIAGMDFTPGEDFLLADEPTDYADQLECLLKDPQLGVKLSRNAHGRVAQSYAREHQSRRLRDEVHALVSPAEKRPR